MSTSSPRYTDGRVPRAPSPKAYTLVNAHANASMLHGRAQRELNDRTDDEANRAAREQARGEWREAEVTLLDYIANLESRAAADAATTEATTP